MLEELKKPLWSGYTNQLALSLSVWLMSIKSDWNVPQGVMDEILHLIIECTWTDAIASKSYYEEKELVSRLGLTSKQINYCCNGCILYYKCTIDLDRCNFFDAPRYIQWLEWRTNSKPIHVKRMHYLPIIPRLKWLCASMNSTPHMKWHDETWRVDGIICHPFDGNTLKEFIIDILILW